MLRLCKKKTFTFLEYVLGLVEIMLNDLQLNNTVIKLKFL